MSFWGCPQCEANRHRLALLCLAERGYETYAPLVGADHLRRGSVVEAAPRLLFNCYLFVWIEAQWHEIARTPGVRSLVYAAGGVPARVPDLVVESLRRREDEHGLIPLPSKPPRGLHKGDRVHIVRGAFQGLSGLSQGQSTRDRIRILLSILNAPRVVELPTDSVEAQPKRGPDRPHRRR